jgi:hypothetical protein
MSFYVGIFLGYLHDTYRFYIPTIDILTHTYQEVC